MDPSTQDQADLEARLRSELTRYSEPIEPSQRLRAAVNRLADRQHPTTWVRWRGPLIAAAAVTAIATLTSIVLLTRGQNTTSSTQRGTAAAQPFASEPTPSPELELDPPTAVAYSEGEHGTPSDDFRALGQKAADALQGNDLQALSDLQDSASQQPNLMAGLIKIYGGRPITATEYTESSIREFPFAAVDYIVDCATGKDVQLSLRFNYIDGRLVLLPLQQEDLSAPAPDLSGDTSLPASAATSAATGPADVPALGTMRYPSCSR